MTTKEMLQIMRTLSAIESALFTFGKCSLPDYLHEQVGNAVDVLELEILSRIAGGDA